MRNNAKTKRNLGHGRLEAFQSPWRKGGRNGVLKRAGKSRIENKKGVRRPQGKNKRMYPGPISLRGVTVRVAQKNGQKQKLIERGQTTRSEKNPERGIEKKDREGTREHHRNRKEKFWGQGLLEKKGEKGYLAAAKRNGGGEYLKKSPKVQPGLGITLTLRTMKTTENPLQKTNDTTFSEKGEKRGGSGWLRHPQFPEGPGESRD